MRDLQAAVLQRTLADEDRDLKFFRKYFHTFDVIAVLMGDENGPHLLHAEAYAFHPLFRFAAGDAGIHQYRILAIAHIIAIAVAARIDGRDKKRHRRCKINAFRSLRKNCEKIKIQWNECSRTEQPPDPAPCVTAASENFNRSYKNRAGTGRKKIRQSVRTSRLLFLPCEAVIFMR